MEAMVGVVVALVVAVVCLVCSSNGRQGIHPARPGPLTRYLEGTPTWQSIHNPCSRHNTYRSHISITLQVQLSCSWCCNSLSSLVEQVVVGCPVMKEAAAVVAREAEKEARHSYKCTCT